MKSTNIKALLHAFLIGISLLSLNTRAGVEITYIYNDALGTPIAGADEQGNVKWRAHYQPYGVELLGERQLFGVRAGYTGQRDDPETGLTYMGARYYSPSIGRFMGVDPAGVSESNIYSFNRYAYANNNPYRFVDPNGESPVSVGLIFIARETGIGYGLGVIADSVSQYAAFGEVDIQLALTSNAAIAGGEAGLFSGVVRSFVSGIAAAKGLVTKGGLNPQQAKNLARFNKKKPANSIDTIIRDLPGGGKAFQADSAARNIPGSFARFEKQIDSAGKTTQFTKTTFGPKGEIVHVKDKITGQTFVRQ